MIVRQVLLWGVLISAAGLGPAVAQSYDVCNKRQAMPTLVLGIEAGHKYALNGNNYTAQQLPSVLLNIMSSRNDKTLWLVAQRDLSYVDLQRFEDFLFHALPGLKLAVILDDKGLSCIPGLPSGPATAMDATKVPR